MVGAGIYVIQVFAVISILHCQLAEASNSSKRVFQLMDQILKGVMPFFPLLSFKGFYSLFLFPEASLPWSISSFTENGFER